MHTVDLKINLLDLLDKKKGDDGQERDLTTAEMDKMVYNIIQSAVLSFHQGDAGVGAVSQRKIDRILDAIESAFENAGGKLTIRDELFTDLQKMWEERKFKPAGGADRKLIQRVDRRICPDAYKGEDEAEDSEET